jgi:integrase
MAKYKRQMREGIEERVYPTGKKSYFVPVPHGNRQHWHKVPDPQTWAHARTHKRRILADMDRGEYVDKKKRNMPLSDFCAYFFSVRHLELRPNSQRIYQRHIDRLIVPHLGVIPLGHLTPEDIQRWKTSLLSDGLAPSTTRSVINLLRQILARAVDWQYLTRNVAKMVDLPPLPPTEMKIWDDDEVQAFLGQLPPAWVCLFKVPLLTGLRLGEVQGMQWDNLEGQSYIVRQQYSTLTRSLEAPKTSESATAVYHPHLTDGRSEGATAGCRGSEAQDRVLERRRRSDLPLGARGTD